MKKVLFITYDFPFPANSGGKNRAFNLIKNTSSKTEIYLFSFVRDGFKKEYIGELEKIGVKETFIYKRKKLKSFSTITQAVLSKDSIFKVLYFEKKAENQILEIVKEKKIDIVHFESSYTGFYLSFKLKDLGVVQILGTENIEHKLYFEYAKSLSNPILKPIVLMHAKRFQKEEISMMRNADFCTAVTHEELEFVKQYSKCFVLENGIDVKEFNFSKKEEFAYNLLFVGNFTYFPNIKAIKFFHSQVFKKLDAFWLTVVGKKGNRQGVNDERVTFKDFVEDLKVEYNKADIFVFPVEIGGGTNFKVLEAMALGVPIVAFPQRLSGLKAEEGKHFLGASDSEQFVSQIKKLSEDKDLRSSLTRNARKLVEENFSWEIIGKKLIDIWQN